jgi:hypothetical protein
MGEEGRSTQSRAKAILRMSGVKLKDKKKDESIAIA